MSRSGYTDDCDGDYWSLIRWRGAVKSAIRGARGQAMLKETLAALDAMPEKKLASESLVTHGGEYCTLGVLGASRGMDMSNIDPDDREAVAKAFGIAEALAAEIVYLNDEHIETRKLEYVEICGPVRPYYPEHGRHRVSVWSDNENAPKERFNFMRDWLVRNIKPAASA